jgi:4-diphosphocytidyl-2-C-methyl-D-erythritol kinase
MNELVLYAPAKLNLTLDITGIAPNGYHTLDMVMQTISLFDTITLSLSDHIELACPPWLPNGPKNLAFRAAEKLCEAAGVQKGALITLEKQIPAQAGMGGGSADAAAVLIGLNALWELGLTIEELRAIGLKLGSDVPFAIGGGTARVRGVGEAVEPIEGYRPLWYLLAKPEGGVGTAEAYKLYDEVGAVRRPQTERFIEALRAGDIEAMARYGGNALEKAAIELLPPVGDLIRVMKTTGAGYCAMTGSGAAVFAAFESEADARAAQKALGEVFWSAVARSYVHGWSQVMLFVDDKQI